MAKVKQTMMIPMVERIGKSSNSLSAANTAAADLNNFQLLVKRFNVYLLEKYILVYTQNLLEGMGYGTLRHLLVWDTIHSNNPVRKSEYDHE